MAAAQDTRSNVVERFVFKPAIIRVVFILIEPIINGRNEVNDPIGWQLARLENAAVFFGLIVGIAIDLIIY